jgi:hypothetical protein
MAAVASTVGVAIVKLNLFKSGNSRLFLRRGELPGRSEEGEVAFPGVIGLVGAAVLVVVEVLEDVLVVETSTG